MDIPVLLIVAVLGGGNFSEEHPMPNMAACERSIATSRVEIPNGDENERGLIMYCIYKDQTRSWLGRLTAWPQIINEQSNPERRRP